MPFTDGPAGESVRPCAPCSILFEIEHRDGILIDRDRRVAITDIAMMEREASNRMAYLRSSLRFTRVEMRFDQGYPLWLHCWDVRNQWRHRFK